MATQPLANTITKVQVEGRKESIEKLHNLLVERTSKKVNKRTERPFSVIGDLDLTGIGNGEEYRGTFLVTRDQIRGNHKNDVWELLRNVSAKANVTLKTEITEYARTQTEKIERPKKEQADTEVEPTENQ